MLVVLLSIFFLIFLPSSSVCLSSFIISIFICKCLRTTLGHMLLRSYSHTEWYLHHCVWESLLRPNICPSTSYNNNNKLIILSVHLIQADTLKRQILKTLWVSGVHLKAAWLSYQNFNTSHSIISNIYEAFIIFNKYKLLSR